MIVVVDDCRWWTNGGRWVMSGGGSSGRKGNFVFLKYLISPPLGLLEGMSISVTKTLYRDQWCYFSKNRIKNVITDKP